MGKYKTFGSRFDRVHRNDLNANFAAVEADINAQKTRVDELITGTPQPSEVVDARGGFPVLSGRLNDLSSSLAQSMTQLSPNTVYNGPIVTIIDDDSYDQFFTLWKPITDAKNFKMTLAVTNNSLDTTSKMTLAELQQLKTEGFEIVSHGVTHPDVNTIDEATWESNCSGSKDFVISNGLGIGEIMVYPIGFTNATAAQKAMVKKVTRKHFKYGVDAQGGVNTLPVDSYQVKRQGLSATYETNKGYVDDAIAKNGWLIFLSHSNASIGSTMLNQLIDYIQSNNIPILTFSDAEKLVGNSISYGDSNTPNYFFASKNGLVKYNDNLQPLNFTMDMAIENYLENKITTTHLLNTKDTFLSTGGVLQTYRGTTLMSYQMYHSVNDGIFKRQWLDGTSTWGSWEKIDTLRTRRNTAGLMDDPISTYAKNTETIVPLSTPNDTYLGIGGVMRVYRSYSDLYSYATYTPFNANTIHMRKWHNGNALWSPWFNVSGNNNATTTKRATMPAIVGQTLLDTTLSKPVWCKTAGALEVETLTITAGATATGNITITLNGVAVPVAVAAGDSAGAIGDKIRATAFSGWTVGGTAGSATVKFSKNTSGTNTAPVFADTGVTGSVASFVVTTAGTANVWVDATGTTV
jgi:peptidoglycan/xylan/chitin deacetylase (PgdA/CDA1 family)